MSGDQNSLRAMTIFLHTASDLYVLLRFNMDMARGQLRQTSSRLMLPD